MFSFLYTSRPTIHVGHIYIFYYLICRGTYIHIHNGDAKKMPQEEAQGDRRAHVECERKILDNYLKKVEIVYDLQPLYIWFYGLDGHIFSLRVHAY